MDRYLGESIPKLGFGLMRLPKLADGSIDVEQVKEMVDLFLSAGFRYFDTAYGYDNGGSERAAKAALVDRYPRDSFYLATKLPAWTAKTKQDAQQMFYTSLERTGAGYFDFYLLHNIGKGAWSPLTTSKSGTTSPRAGRRASSSTSAFPCTPRRRCSTRC